MARIALRAGLLVALQLGANAFPKYWAGKKADDVRGYQPGSNFGVMGIAKLESQTAGACVLSSNVPAEGYNASTPYMITVTSNVSGGVGIVLVRSSGDFAENSKPYTDAPALKVPMLATAWRSPANGNSSEFFAICVTGGPGGSSKAYVAQPLVLKQAGAVAPVCAVSNTTAVASLCRCPKAGVEQLCAAGLCCSADGCAACPGTAPADASPSLWTIWVHALAMALAWAYLLPAGALVARHRALFKPAGAWFPWHRALQSVGFAVFVAAFILAIISVQSRGGSHFSGYNAFHKIVGLIVVILGTLQAIGGYLRPGINSPSHDKWGSAHKAFGYFLILLAFVALIAGLVVAYQSGQKGLFDASLAVTFLGAVLCAIAFVALSQQFHPAAPAQRPQTPSTEMSRSALVQSA